jgi:hypothetical protein
MLWMREGLLSEPGAPVNSLGPGWHHCLEERRATRFSSRPSASIGSRQATLTHVGRLPEHAPRDFLSFVRARRGQLHGVDPGGGGKALTVPIES